MFSRTVQSHQSQIQVANNPDDAWIFDFKTFCIPFWLVHRQVIPPSNQINLFWLKCLRTQRQGAAYSWTVLHCVFVLWNPTGTCCFWTSCLCFSFSLQWTQCMPTAGSSRAAMALAPRMRCQPCIGMPFRSTRGKKMPLLQWTEMNQPGYVFPKMDSPLNYIFSHSLQNFFFCASLMTTIYGGHLVWWG